jgi:hypothetical protein
VSWCCQIVGVGLAVMHAMLCGGCTCSW